MSECVCGAPTECQVSCDKHNRVNHGWPCPDCEQEWRAKNPRTADAIARYAAGNGSLSAIKKARKEDSDA